MLPSSPEFKIDEAAGMETIQQRVGKLAISSFSLPHCLVILWRLIARNDQLK